MKRTYFVLLSLFISQFYSMLPEGCFSKQEFRSSIQQAHKLLSVQEASYLQSLRALRKKLKLLHDTVAPLPVTPKNVHFLCDPGYELVGSETRQCKDLFSWSGQQPICKVFVSITNTSSATAGAAAASSIPMTHTYSFVRQSKCRQVQGTIHCTCEPGYIISGPDKSLCTDIDECKLHKLHNGQTGQLCLHLCVNIPGGYQCACPAGYNLTSNGRNCKDFDECGTRQNNCTRDQLCINTFGGFQCVEVECPPIQNASYAKTSSMRCERNPCPVDNKACSQAPNSVSYHYISVVSNLSAPRVMFRMSASKVIGDTLRFALLGGSGRRFFTVQRFDHQTGELLLISPVQGPSILDLEVEMSELKKSILLGRYTTKITVFVSQFKF